jgi:protein subunit release factor A
MEEYSDELHKCIRSLFKENTFKLEIKMIKNEDGQYNHDASVGVKATHMASGKEAVCEKYKTQVQNANIALLMLKAAVDEGCCS